MQAVQPPAHAHSLTFSCFRRQPFLARDASRGWMVDGVRLARERHRVDLRARVVMPEHVHLLIFPREPAHCIGGFLTTMKQSVAKRAIAYVRAEAPQFVPQRTDRQPNGKASLRSWQRGGYDQNLWSPNKVWEKIAYIHTNRVRRKHVARPEDWPWYNHSDYAGTGEGLLPINRESLPT